MILNPANIRGGQSVFDDESYMCTYIPGWKSALSINPVYELGGQSVCDDILMSSGRVSGRCTVRVFVRGLIHSQWVWV